MDYQTDTSTPIPKAVVATMIRLEPEMNRNSCFSRLSESIYAMAFDHLSRKAVRQVICDHIHIFAGTTIDHDSAVLTILFDVVVYAAEPLLAGQFGAVLPKQRNVWTVQAVDDARYSLPALRNL